jgi:hypothetical protein
LRARLIDPRVVAALTIFSSLILTASDEEARGAPSLEAAGVISPEAGGASPRMSREVTDNGWDRITLMDVMCS